MTIQNVTSTDNLGYHGNRSQVYQPVHMPTAPGNGDLLTPEQQNTIKDSFDAKMAEQVENIKSNYQTAKDIDLTQAYYQQQQKLFDIYLQSSTDTSVESSSSSSTSINAVGSLTDMYTLMHNLHKQVREGVENLPIKERPTIGKPEVVINTANNNVAINDKQLQQYNELMVPVSSSYMHLSA